jgi:hypothetical protein
MAVLVSVVVPGLTTEAYDRMSQDFTPEARKRGMQLHAAGQVEGGWQFVEIWSSREGFERFISEVVAPVMSQMGGPMPQFTVVEAHNIIGLSPS